MDAENPLFDLYDLSAMPDMRQEQTSAEIRHLLTLEVERLDAASRPLVLSEGMTSLLSTIPQGEVESAPHTTRGRGWATISVAYDTLERDEVEYVWQAVRVGFPGSFAVATFLTLQNSLVPDQIDVGNLGIGFFDPGENAAEPARTIIVSKGEADQQAQITDADKTQQEAFLYEIRSMFVNLEAMKLIADLSLPKRIAAILRVTSFRTQAQLERLSDQEIEAIDGIAKASRKLIREALSGPTPHETT